MIKLASKFALLNIISLALTDTAIAKKEVYYGCESGFLYESKKDAAHCIKQEKFLYQAPIACKTSSDKNLRYKLEVDKVGLNDKCVLQNNAALSNQLLRTKMTNNAVQKLIDLKCQPGYLLTIRKGKDACTKVSVEEIKPPNRKIIR